MNQADQIQVINNFTNIYQTLFFLSFPSVSAPPSVMYVFKYIKELNKYSYYVCKLACCLWSTWTCMWRALLIKKKSVRVNGGATLSGSP